MFTNSVKNKILILFPENGKIKFHRNSFICVEQVKEKSEAKCVYLLQGA